MIPLSSLQKYVSSTYFSLTLKVVFNFLAIGCKSPIVWNISFSCIRYLQKKQNHNKRFQKCPGNTLRTTSEVLTPTLVESKIYTFSC